MRGRPVETLFPPISAPPGSHGSVPNRDLRRRGVERLERKAARSPGFISPIPVKLFGTAGVRGKTNVEIGPDLCLQISLAFGTWIRRRRGTAGQIGLAHDTRFGAGPLAGAAAAGIASSGNHVVDYGILPAGAFCLNLTRAGADGGVFITGSHMPYDRIGILLLMEDGAYAPRDVTDEIERIVSNRDFLRVEPEQIGGRRQGSAPAEVYAETLLQHVDRRAIASRSFKVLIDPANGAASAIARDVFERAGCEVISINATMQPIPNRPSEPRARTVEEACNVARVLRVDLGLCLDVDADRALFVTGKGEPLSEDLVGGIFAQEELQPDEVCVAPVSSSGLIEWVARRTGARLEYCRIGQPETIRAVKEHGAVFAYEESGKYYFTRTFLWSDGIFSGLKMLEILTKKRRTLSDLVQTVPPFFQAKEAVQVPDRKKAEIMKRVSASLETRAAEGKVRDVRIDGIKRVYRDDAWLLIRSSGTEPLIRVFSDAPSPERARQLVEEGLRLVRAAIP